MPTKTKLKTKAPGIPRKPRATRPKKETANTVTSDIVEEKKIQKSPEKKDYLFAVGRRKRSVARVRYHKNGTGEITINGKPFETYFPYFEFQKIIRQPLELAQMLGTGSVTVKVTGGGKRGQAEATQLGISRVLLLVDQDSKPLLRAHRLLTRDSRIKERKKYGLKKARRAPQWQKR